MGKRMDFVKTALYEICHPFITRAPLSRISKSTSCVPEFNTRQLAAESARLHGGSADFWKVLGFRHR